MRLAVIGAGNVGKALGKAWGRRGHDVTYGVRQPGDAKYAGLKTAAVAEAARAAEAILLATPWEATEAALSAAGDLTGKLLLDATNPLAIGPHGIGLALGHSISGGEKVAAWAKGAAVFKTLNTTGFNNMENSGGYAQKPVMFFAGDDSAKRATVAALIADLGFEPVAAGPLVNARLLEPYAMLWIDLAMKRGQGRDIAFALMKRK
ncbi:MAG TPA: NAD(P)-binding domain-containing protein [Stellaceae bacterium]|jgi:8-hydroxy-5-deazaflavin:NADPH oxidoreductase|nr:NAD(P)-binding domain-containing protein [Stellaceae bacterium]